MLPPPTSTRCLLTARTFSVTAAFSAVATSAIITTASFISAAAISAVAASFHTAAKSFAIHLNFLLPRLFFLSDSADPPRKVHSDVQATLTSSTSVTKVCLVFHRFHKSQPYTVQLLTPYQYRATASKVYPTVRVCINNRAASESKHPIQILSEAKFALLP